MNPPRLAPLAPLLFLAVGCQAQQFHATDDGGDDSGPVSASVTIDALEPDSGPETGGTTVRVTGSGFSDASTATVGGAACTSLTFLSASELVCITPPGLVGGADLVVSDGEAGATTLFVYLDAGNDTGDSGTDTGDTGDSTADSADSGDSATDTGDSGDTDTDTGALPVPVDYCHIQYPCSVTVASGTASELVYGWVYLVAVTPGVGEGLGVRLQIGVGGDGTDPATGAWTWAEMAYNTDKDGLSAGDLSNDEYAGTFVAPGSPGSYDYALRATADDGLSWLYCDVGGETCGGLGSDDGYSPAEAGQCAVN